VTNTFIQLDRMLDRLFVVAVVELVAKDAIDFDGDFMLCCWCCCCCCCCCSYLEVYSLDAVCTDSGRPVTGACNKTDSLVIL
jgi:hypothetical protein